VDRESEGEEQQPRHEEGDDRIGHAREHLHEVQRLPRDRQQHQTRVAGGAGLMRRDDRDERQQHQSAEQRKAQYHHRDVGLEKPAGHRAAAEESGDGDGDDGADRERRQDERHEQGERPRNLLHAVPLLAAIDAVDEQPPPEPDERAKRGQEPERVAEV
jgi:hypothetical protein